MSDPIRSYRDLVAWQKTYALGRAVYGLAGKFPDAERFGLVQMIRRLSITIPSNIAQGYGRGNTTDYLWFLKAARGELYQLDTQLLFAVDFKYIPDDEYQRVKRDLDESERVLAGLIKSLGG